MFTTQGEFLYCWGGHSLRCAPCPCLGVQRLLTSISQHSNAFDKKKTPTRLSFTVGHPCMPHSIVSTLAITMCCDLSFSSGSQVTPSSTLMDVSSWQTPGVIVCVSSLPVVGRSLGGLGETTERARLSSRTRCRSHSCAAGCTCWMRTREKSACFDEREYLSALLVIATDSSDDRANFPNATVTRA